MFKTTLNGIKTWTIHSKIWINYVNPVKCEPPLRDLHEETIIVIDNHSFPFNGDLRRELLETEGDLYKLLEWYQYNVWFDLNCQREEWADTLVSTFYHKIKRFLPKKKKNTD